MAIEAGLETGGAVRLPCHIVGVLDNGPEGLTPDALNLIRRADVLIGARRTLALFQALLPGHVQCHDLTRQLGRVPEWVRQAQAEGLRVVVLATGDPLCHGIAAFLQSRLCLDACEVVPNVSMLQLACARLGLPWQDLRLVSVHGPDAGEWKAGQAGEEGEAGQGAGPRHGLYPILQAVQRYERVAVLTSPANSPDRIARMLVRAGLGDALQMAVAESLLQPGERVWAGCTPAEVATLRFTGPNVVLLCRVALLPAPVLFGLEDGRFEQRTPERGLITKREVRAVSLARLQLRRTSVVWDIGAGSGSVGLEAARLCPEGEVYAIEKNAADVAIARRNRQHLGIFNHVLVHGKAPEGLAAWPDPDAVFIGGSGGELAELIPLCLARLRPGGWLVMNLVTFENMGLALDALNALAAAETPEKSAGVLEWDVTQISTARSRRIIEMHRLAAENPVWVVCARWSVLSGDEA